MVKLHFFSSVIALVFVSNLWGMAQDESGLSLNETIWANAEAIHNYDVSYKHWQGFSPSEPPSEDFLEHTECVTFGRLVVNRKDENILFVREMTFDLTKKQRKRFELFIWRKGVATAFSRDRPRPYTSKVDFVKFNETYLVPIVELTLSSFPRTMSKNTLEEMHASSTLHYQTSRCIRRPDGSSRVSTQRDSTRLRTDVIFDPVSSMPTSSVISEFDPRSNTVTRILSSGNPRFEKSKEVYRIASTAYEKLEFAGQNLTLQSVGTCDFTWHQFNEESLQFPYKDVSSFGIAEAERFLRQGIAEQAK